MPAMEPLATDCVHPDVDQVRIASATSNPTEFPRTIRPPSKAIRMGQLRSRGSRLPVELRAEDDRNDKGPFTHASPVYGNPSYSTVPPDRPPHHTALPRRRLPDLHAMLS